MERTISCPNCNQLLRIAEAAWHQDLRCSRCWQVFRPDSMQIQASSPTAQPPLAHRDTEVIPPRQELGPVRWEAGQARKWDDRRLFLIQPQSTWGLCIATLAMLVVSILSEVASIPLEISYTRFIDLLIQNPEPPEEELIKGERLEDVLRLIGWGQIVLRVATAVPFLMWLYRSYANLTALGAQGLAFSPGWTVGYFFIPIVNLFRPYQVLQETWKGSDPDYASTNSMAWKAAPGSALVGLWWALWLISNVAGQISFRIHMNQEPRLDAFKVSSLASMVSALAALVCGFCLLFVVYGITARQEEKHRRPRAEEPDPEIESPSFEAPG
jgi:phage FluMu protein Com